MFIKNFLENTFNSSFSFLKSYVTYYTLPLFTFGIKTFFFYKNIETDVTIKLKNMYHTNEVFHNIFNFVNFFPRLIDSELFDYNTEPIEESWINSILYYEDSKKEIVLKENYETFIYKNI